MNPDLTGLNAWAGDNQDKMLKALYTELVLEAAGISVIPNLKSSTTLHKLLVRKGAKPYTGTFKSKDDIYFEPRTLSVEKVQRDLSVEPSKYLQTFMEKRRGAGENSKNMTIPFAEVMWSSVLEELAQEIVSDTVYHGVGKAAFAAYAAGTAYSVGDLIKFTQDGELRYFRCISATSAGQSPDTHPLKWDWAGGRALCKGLGTLIDAEETAGNITAESTGAITNTTAYAQFTAVWRRLPEKIRMKAGNIYCSQNSMEALLDDVENKVTKNFETIDGITYLAKTEKKAKIVPVNWLSGSGKIIASAPGNFWMGTDQASDMTTIKVKEEMYHLDAGITFMLGFQIADIEAMAINDQD